MAKLKCPENCGGCSVGGIEYTANKKGFVEVPDEFVESLISHGYTIDVSKSDDAYGEPGSKGKGK